MITLDPYQIEGAEWLVETRRAILADLPGVGKSFQVLEAMSRIGGSHLLVCPAGLISPSGWIKHLTEFGAIPAAYTIEDFRLLKDTNRVLVLSYEKAKRLETELLRTKFATVTFDEAHRLSSRTSKTCMLGRRLARGSPNVFFLTGTPLRNSIMDVWTLLNMIDKKKFGSYWRFAEEYAITTSNGFGLDVIDPPPQSRKMIEFSKMLTSYILQRSLEDVGVTLPPQVVEDVLVDTSPEVDRIAYELTKNAFAELPNSSITIKSALSLLMRLRQLAVDIDLVASPESDSPLYGPKADEAVTLIDLYRDTKVIVFTSFATAARRFHARLVEEGVPSELICGDVSQTQRNDAVDRFLNKDSRVLVCTLQTGSTGHTWLEAKITITLDRLFVPADMAQAFARNHRRGQDSHVRVYNLVTPNSVDQHIQKILETKTRSTSSALQIVRELREALL